jgi:oligoribonuclease (3'-5' exoribonuclease)
MTGLNPTTHTILSISCLITSADLALLDPTGFNATIHHSPAQLAAMSPWCITQHTASGLTQQCLASPTTAYQAAADLLTYIKRYVPEKGKALLAGNSIHADKMFLMNPPWDVILEYLHYRLFDVSACKEMVRRWCSDEVLRRAPKKELRHTAREDVLESLQEARYYKTLFEGLSPS